MIPKEQTGTQLPDRITQTAFVALVLFTGGACDSWCLGRSFTKAQGKTESFLNAGGFLYG
jgi:hypothetical protein